MTTKVNKNISFIKTLILSVLATIFTSCNPGMITRSQLCFRHGNKTDNSHFIECRNNKNLLAILEEAIVLDTNSETDFISSGSIVTVTIILKDSSGSILPYATVTVVGPSTSLRETATSSGISDGNGLITLNAKVGSSTCNVKTQDGTDMGKVRLDISVTEATPTVYEAVAIVTALSGSKLGNTSVIGAAPISNTHYSVGGSISNLTASGLVIQNSGINNLSISSGSLGFRFPKGYKVGFAYDVKVLTQPTGLSCNVVNGSGTISANVSNVQISCAPSSSTSSCSFSAPANSTFDSVNCTFVCNDGYAPSGNSCVSSPGAKALSCSSGSVMVGIEGTGGWGVDKIRPVCAPTSNLSSTSLGPQNGNSPGGDSFSNTSLWSGKSTKGDGTESSNICSSGKVVVGADGNNGAYGSSSLVNGLNMISKIRIKCDTYPTRSGNITKTVYYAIDNISNKTPFDDTCPSGKFAYGLINQEVTGSTSYAGQHLGVLCR
jgi:hypothetical protein